MLHKNTGIFISFEGTEGSGKSTLIRHLSASLSDAGRSVVQTREPGGSPIAEKIRTILLETAMDPRTELLLYEAGRSEHLAQTIRPALLAGKVVLCDRYTASTLAYQAHARSLPWTEVKAFNRLTTAGLEPDLTVFLDIDPALGLKRAQDPNRFEAEGLAFQKKVRLGYLKARAENPKRWFTLKAKDKTPEELTQLVIKEMSRRFKNKLKGN